MHHYWKRQFPCWWDTDRKMVSVGIPTGKYGQPWLDREIKFVTRQKTFPCRYKTDRKNGLRQVCSVFYCRMELTEKLKLTDRKTIVLSSTTTLFCHHPTGKYLFFLSTIIFSVGAVLLENIKSPGYSRQKNSSQFNLCRIKINLNAKSHP